jgi:glycosyltransferase involved in cell wall biosynthesis
MEEALVSCIIATHNDGRYLHDSIPSVLNQTYKNIECIVIDDGSTDDTSQIVERWTSDQRFLYAKQTQSGVAKARNAGVQRSKGSYIAFLDADDRWDASKIESQLHFLLGNPQLDFCWSDQELMDYSGRPLELSIKTNPEFPLTKQILTSGWNAPPSCWLVKRELLEVTGGFDEAIPSGHEDVELMFRMADRAFGARSPDAFVWRRVRPDSVSRDVLSKRVQSVRVYQQMLSYENGKYNHLRRQAMFAVHRFLAGHCWQNGAFRAAAVETIRAALWNPKYVFDRAFIDTVFLGQVHRLLSPGSSGKV